MTAAVIVNFTIGAGADPNLDAQAKAAALKELDRWIVESCNSNVDLVNGMVRQGLVSGQVLVGEQRAAKVEGCIKELMQARSK
ncbi:MAG: hypothetical protein Q7J84_16720 [Sulfuricaulis sp.]|nr:hypothetical protein [Sulfuricaulis sp.]